jgi:two-component system, sensor histidine kinase and response regulator
MFDYAVALKNDADPEVVEIIGEIFLETYELELEQLNVALDSGDVETLLLVSHGLKGNLGQFGARPAADLAAKIETLSKAGALTAIPALLKPLQVEISLFVGSLRKHLESII